MAGYVRPRIESPVFHTADGTVIEYGSRWARLGGSPPEDSYSVESHLERFAPLRFVVDALIDHLTATFDVIVEEGYPTTQGMRFRPDPGDLIRAVRILPNKPTAAPVTLVMTRYPTAYLLTGAACGTHYPTCTCDACDETWQTCADDLECDVDRITERGFHEETDKVPGGWWEPWPLGES